MNTNDDQINTGSDYDVVVIGGGAAGLSGSLMLGRMRRSVLVIDSGQPRNAPAAGVHGLLTRDGIPPRELLELGRREVRGYGVSIVDGQVTGTARAGDRFRVTIDNAREVTARRLLVATGSVDELPDVPGLADRWGRDVVHCPYCHGYEVRDRPIAVLATGPMAAHQAQLFRQLSDDVTVLLHRSAPLPAEQLSQLAARGIRLVEGVVTGLEVSDDRLTGVRLENGDLVACQALAVASVGRSRTDFLAPLGLTTVAHPAGAGEQLTADETGRTNVPGVFVAGNASNLTAQVGASAAAGAMAGAMINFDLVADEITSALAQPVG